MKIKKEQQAKERGITLIALVITIIILLILAGISIAMVTGDNGILTQAARAKEETEKAQANEQNTLNGYEDTINEYVGVDWNAVLANAQKHPDQKTSTAIGVGTDGKPVNMDLWECTLLADDTYGLNSEDVFNNQEYGGDNETAVYNNGYVGNYENNKISGTIPTYISSDNGTTWKKVSSLYCTFMNSEELEIAPTIPNTVTNMMNTFFCCTALYEASSIPDSVTSLAGTFYGCTNLKNAPTIGKSVETMSSCFQKAGIESLPKLPEGVKNLHYAFSETPIKKVEYIPNSVTDMSSTFKDCNDLMYVQNIPNGVISLEETFNGCRNLGTINFILGEQIENLYATFQDCEKMDGKIEINANIEGEDDYKYIFDRAGTLGNGIEVTGNSSILSNLQSIYSYNAKIIFNIL